jgi:hypothetical protein
MLAAAADPLHRLSRHNDGVAFVHPALLTGILIKRRLLHLS